jgi:hypothetical protein
MTDDELRQAIRDAVRGEGKPWYAQSPVKEILAHAAAITTAVGIGLVVHKWTGDAVVIESKNAPSPTEPISIPSAFADSVSTFDWDAGLVVENDPPPAAKVVTAPVVKRKKVVEEQLLAEKLAYAPAAPAAPAAGAPAAPTPPASAAAAKKAIILDEIPVGGRRAF